MNKNIYFNIFNFTAKIKINIYNSNLSFFLKFNLNFVLIRSKLK